MKFVVTGDAGLIGSAVIRHIIRNRKNDVINVDKLTYAGNFKSLSEVSGDSRYMFEHDTCDRVALDRIFLTHQPDALMHLAAESHVDRSIDGPSEFIQTNLSSAPTRCLRPPCCIGGVSRPNVEQNSASTIFQPTRYMATSRDP